MNNEPIKLDYAPVYRRQVNTPLLLSWAAVLAGAMNVSAVVATVAFDLNLNRAVGLLLLGYSCTSPIWFAVSIWARFGRHRIGFAMIGVLLNLPMTSCLALAILGGSIHLVAKLLRAAA